MKYQSTYDQNISFEHAKDAPICHLESLRFEAVLSIGGGGCPYFFFRGWKKNLKRRSYVGYYLKYHSLSPYRIMEEHVAYSTVWKYLYSEHQQDSPRTRCRIYRLWGTPYIKEMNNSDIYSNFKEDTENKVSQLMIITDDETVEIVAPQNIEWVKYNPTQLKKIICDLVKNPR